MSNELLDTNARRIGGAIAVTIASALICFGIQQVVGSGLSIGVLSIPIALCAYWGGRDPGLVSTAIAVIAGSWLIAYDDAISTFGIERVVVLGFIGVLGSILCGRLRVARNAMESEAHALRRTSLALKQSEDRFSAAFLSSPVASMIVRVSDWCIVAANEAFSHLHGSPRFVLNGGGTNAIDLFDGSDEWSRLRGLLRGNTSIRDQEAHIQTGSGQRRDVLFSLEPMQLADAPHALVTLYDITERKIAEEALRASERQRVESDLRFHGIADAIDDVFWIAEPETGRTQYVNEAFERVWGRNKSTLLDDPSSWLDAVHPEDRGNVIKQLGQRSSQGRSYDEYRIVRPDGEVRWIRTTVFHVGSGHESRLCGVAQDVTERRALEEQLRQAQKMESLAMLASGIAHDFNNVLAVIATDSELLLESPRVANERELAEEIARAVRRGVGLTRQLLAFSRRHVSSPVVIDANQAITETCKMLRRIVGENVMIATSLDPNLRSVKIDPGLLVQVVMNLSVNARDAMASGGRLRLVTRNIQLDEDFIARHPGAKLGDGIAIEVSDSGSGMTPEVQRRIFEPLFTTKERGRGTGLGLVVVKNVVDQAGGYIDVETRLGEGSTFRIILPATDAASERESAPPPQATGGVEAILVVDDDAYVRQSIARALVAAGYEVEEAADGTEALKRLAARHFELLLTDVVMPIMDGRMLAERAREQQPTLRVLFASGYLDDAAREGLDGPGLDLIEKPFGPGSLLREVRRVLDRDARTLPIRRSSLARPRTRSSKELPAQN
jgi:PAS domain S-box-containing protein